MKFPRFMPRKIVVTCAAVLSIGLAVGTPANVEAAPPPPSAIQGPAALQGDSQNLTGFDRQIAAVPKADRIVISLDEVAKLKKTVSAKRAGSSESKCERHGYKRFGKPKRGTWIATYTYVMAMPPQGGVLKVCAEGRKVKSSTMRDAMRTRITDPRGVTVKRTTGKVAVVFQSTSIRRGECAVYNTKRAGHRYHSGAICVG